MHLNIVDELKPSVMLFDATIGCYVKRIECITEFYNFHSASSLDIIYTTKLSNRMYKSPTFIVKKIKNQLSHSIG